MIEYIEKIPSADEYNRLYASVGWGNTDNAVIDKALENSVYMICAYDGGNIVGFGRLIGDRSMFLYVQDFMVIPEYQGRHIGSEIMKRIIDRVNALKKDNPDIRTYLGASEPDKAEFYRKFGFVTREEAGLGAGMVMF